MNRWDVYSESRWRFGQLYDDRDGPQSIGLGHAVRSIGASRLLFGLAPMVEAPSLPTSRYIIWFGVGNHVFQGSRLALHTCPSSSSRPISNRRIPAVIDWRSATSHASRLPKGTSTRHLIGRKANCCGVAHRFTSRISRCGNQKPPKSRALDTDERDTPYSLLPLASEE